MTDGRVLAPIRITLTPSRYRLPLYGGVALLALAALHAARLPFFPQLFYIAAPAWLILLARSGAGKLPVSAVEIGGSADARVYIRQCWFDASIAGDSYIAPWLVLLRLHLADGRHVAVPLLPWDVPQDVLRRLRVRLQWQRV